MRENGANNPHHKRAASYGMPLEMPGPGVDMIATRDSTKSQADRVAKATPKP
ncbi:hypothetical protein K431DRAFT_282234 [Polychaeton citri CBS 116435]|uniref:Uncharacterized protein n=1 Tax=Polychaeton citri CBS 116435 TaxID=1314669 RepID=A0A9P4QGC8_9PEZI|nr:hypothetical protein K431DRAFT_282234 [Polychaeton citri CBS 116435]